LSSDSEEFSNTTESQYYLEIWQNRAWLWVVVVSALILLLAWGFAIIPTGTLPAWGWWPVTLGCAGLVIYRLRLEQKLARVYLQKSGPPKRLFWKNIPLSLVIALVIGLAVNLLVIARYPQPLRYDSYEYSRIAYQYATQGYTPDAIRPPGYTLFLALIDKITGGPLPQQDKFFGPPLPVSSNVRAAQLFQALLLSLTAVFVYLTVAMLDKGKTISTGGRFNWGRPQPFLAALLVALCPFLIAYTTTTLTEIAAAFWLTVSVFFWVKTLKYPCFILYPALTGLSLAFLMQTRPTFIYLPLLAIITLAVIARGLHRIWQPLVVLVGIILVLMPQFVANLEAYGEPAPVIAADLSTYQTTIGIFYITYGGLPRYQTQLSTASPDPTTEPIWERLQGYLPVQMGIVNGEKLGKTERKALADTESKFFRQYFSDYISSKPLEYAGTVGKRLWWMWNQHFLFPYYDPAYFDYRWLTDNLNLLYLIFGLVGLLVAIPVWKSLAWPLWLSLAYLIAVNALVRIEFRYTLPGYPLLLAFAGLGLYTVGKMTLAKKYNPRIRLAVFAGVALSTLLIGLLSITLPLIPPTNAAREKARDVMAQAEEYNEVRQFWVAEPLYGEAINLYPSEALLWIGRANFYAGKGEPDKAIPDYSKAIELDPKAPDPYRWRGQAFQQVGLLTEAKADYQQFLQLSPLSHPARQKIERVLIQL
jgi:tetratricopeptide (TPR) repeat protein